MPEKPTDINAGIQPSQEAIINNIIAERLKHNVRAGFKEPAPISVPTLQNANPISVPPPPIPSTDGDSAANIAANQAKIETERIKQEQQIRAETETEAQKQAGGLGQEINKLIEAGLGESAFRTKKREELGIIQKESDLESIKNEIDALSVEKGLIAKRLEGTGHTLSRIAGETARKNATLNFEILTKSALHNTLLGNLTAAQRQLEEAVTSQFGPTKELREAKQAQLQALRDSGVLSRDEKIQADAIAARYKKEEQEEEAKKQLKINIANMSLKAHEAGITDKNVLEQIMNAPDIQTAANLIAQYAPNTQVTGLMTKYPDAGITYSDTLEQAQAKLSKSRIYQEQIRPPSSSTLSGLTPGQQQRFVQISTKFQADPIISTATTADMAYQIASQALANPGSAANQMMLLYSLIKVLDPNSAVREGELALAQSTQSYLDRFKTSLEKINSGKIISNDAIKELASGTQVLAGMWKQKAKQRESQYTSQANTVGLGKEWKEYTDGFQSTATSTTPPPQKIVEYPKGSGKKYSVDEKGEMTPIK